MSNVQNLDGFAYPIEDFIGVVDDEEHPYFGIIGSISAKRMLAQLRDSVANARSNLAGAARKNASSGEQQ